jgi:exodeoxyribonuclease III
MKLTTWNVNGIRASLKGGFENWFRSEKADIICLQEIKAFREQLEPETVTPEGYHSFWHSAKKPGYSGVAVFSKEQPIDVQEGFGFSEIDDEGRVLILHYPKFTLLNCYFPNSQREHGRLNYKLFFCDEVLKYCEKLKKEGKNVILCGDLNIAHKEIDLKNPKSNENNAGFLPEERSWMDKYINSGMVDSFRYFDNSPGNYTWWSYRPGVREKNIGWRLDYFIVNSDFAKNLKSVVHQTQVRGSDHCPVQLKLSL